MSVLFHSLLSAGENRRVKIFDQFSSKFFIFPYTSDITFLCDIDKVIDIVV
jgi:hypothetical protein